MLLALFLLSGIISLFELMRMRNHVSDLLLENVNNLTMSREVLMLNTKISYTTQTLLEGNDIGAQVNLQSLDSLMLTLRNAQEKREIRDTVMNDIIENAANILLRLHNLSLQPFYERRTVYYATVLPAYHQLRQQVDRLMDYHQQILIDNTKAVEESRYRAAMPSIISTFSGGILLLLFHYFLLSFFVNPLVKITRATENTVDYKAPFKVNILESDDEIGDLKEAISQLVIQVKKSQKKE
ncbi:MAG: hypothetical protein ACRC9X_01805 [Bacteroidales bacterium]